MARGEKSEKTPEPPLFGPTIRCSFTFLSRVTQHLATKISAAGNRAGNEPS